MNPLDLIIGILIAAIIISSRKAFKCYKKGVRIKLSKEESILLIAAHGKLGTLIRSGEVKPLNPDKFVKVFTNFRHQAISQLEDIDFVDKI